ncbi:universal stress protein [Haloterrigena sp. H1]|uniref:universal stress protein n=1 Tax=Haloterrigena sp. H1 TaxID=2552943 RepID=UPI00110F4495|nr:universal stress protein [Haloterrigena sp. H1]TMT81611.1 universal stress protein [Haloterrigena sp. H1]
MSTNILVPIDRSSQSTAGLVYTLVSFPDATITAIHVTDTEHDAYATVGSPESSEEQLEHASERLLEQAVETAAEYGCELETVLERGIPHRTIVEYTVEHDIDHIVLGSHGESPIVRPFLGHVSEAVVRRAPVSTTIVPEAQSELLEREFPGRILVPVDGSDQALAALEYATNQFSEGRITVFHAVSLPFEYDVDAIDGTYLERIVDDLTEQGDSVLEAAGETIEGDDLAVETELQYGEPSRSIVDYAADNGFDQIVMGSHGRSLPARLITGSVAQTVSRRSTIPVTLVRGRPSDSS